jgi:POT family proton-dependent oligopeptide transporter
MIWTKKGTHFLQSLKHPKALPIFFFTELWERYGFYVVQSLLALYLAIHFKWSDSEIYRLVGSFTAITYLSPFVGGFIADKYLGQKISILLGGAILAIGYLLLSLTQQINLMTLELAGIAIGTGLLKPNISSLLGTQYTKDCYHREQGFTIFYLGITTGIILGTTLPSLLHQYFGWKIAFLSAAVGMLFSMVTFIIGMKKYTITNHFKLSMHFKNILLASFVLALCWLLCSLILLKPKFADFIFPLVGFMTFAYLLFLIVYYKNDAKNMSVILFLCVISVIFWSFYFQMFMSLTLFIIRAVRVSLWKIPFPPPYYVTIQSFGMLFIGYFIAKKKFIIHPQEVNKNIIKKFMFSLFYMFLAYAFVFILCFCTQRHERIPVLYLIPTYLLISIGELYLSPVGLSAITVLSNPNRVSRMIGIFFVSLGLGGYLSGKLSNITALESTHLNISQLKIHYGLGFLQLSIILLLCLVFSLCYQYGLRIYLKKK